MDTESHSMIFMPSYPKKSKKHFVQFLWDSTSHGILYTNQIIGNAQGNPIRLLGKVIGQQALGELHLEVFQHKPTWRPLYFHLSSYK